MIQQLKRLLNQNWIISWEAISPYTLYIHIWKLTQTWFWYKALKWIVNNIITKSGIMFGILLSYICQKHHKQCLWRKTLPCREKSNTKLENFVLNLFSHCCNLCKPFHSKHLACGENDKYDILSTHPYCYCVSACFLLLVKISWLGGCGALGRW